MTGEITIFATLFMTANFLRVALLRGDAGEGFFVFGHYEIHGLAHGVAELVVSQGDDGVCGLHGDTACDGYLLKRFHGAKIREKPPFASPIRHPPA